VKPCPLSVAFVGFLAAASLIGISGAALRADAQTSSSICGDANFDTEIKASDALSILRRAVGHPISCPPSRCDTDNDSFLHASDALRVLRFAVGLPVVLECPEEAVPGILLPGEPGAPAQGAVVELEPTPAAPVEVVENLLMTRLEALLGDDATVGDVNAALEAADAAIVSMRAASPFVTLAVPQQPSAAALQQIADQLVASGAFFYAGLAYTVEPNVLPPGGAGDVGFMSSLRTMRFPAAWNASRLAMSGNATIPACTSRKVAVVVPDAYAVNPLPPSYATAFPSQIPNFTAPGFSAPAGEAHGYDVVTTMAAAFDAVVPTGANPFPQCLEITGLQVSGLSQNDITNLLAASLPQFSGHVIVNASFGFAECFTDACTPADLSLQYTEPLDRVFAAVDMRAAVASREDDVLFATAAGNDRAKSITKVYPGTGQSSFTSSLNMAGSVGVDPSSAALGTLWDSHQTCGSPPCFPDLSISNEFATTVHDYFALKNMLGPALDNVLITGSVNQFGDTESTFSDAGATALAIGEGISTIAGIDQGTSFAAPAVAGLVSYLWLLSPELRQRPVSTTIDAIVANESKGTFGEPAAGLINAYATVLSLDEAATPSPATAPVRLAILDVDGDGDFDLDDIAQYAGKYIVDGEAIDPLERDHSRWDLNGDGFTGGPETAEFDLDRVGSTQYGAPVLGTVEEAVAGRTKAFNELALTDADILCYYVWSGLYGGPSPEDGSPDARVAALRGICGEGGSTFEGDLVITGARDESFDDGSFQYDIHFDYRVDAHVVLIVNDDGTFGPSGDATLTATGQQTASPLGEGISCTYPGQWTGSGEPTEYTGSDIDPSGVLFIAGTYLEQYFRDPTEGCSDDFSFSGDIGFPFIADHVFVDGVLRSIVFNDSKTVPSPFHPGGTLSFNATGTLEPPP
jgi:Subtilase family